MNEEEVANHAMAVEFLQRKSPLIDKLEVLDQ